MARLGPPDGYRPESRTIWSFPDRGGWATHDGRYRGNWSPYVPRNLLERFTRPGEVVLDPMMGSGTTLVECRLLGRAGIGVDINPDAVLLAHSRLAFSLPQGLGGSLPRVRLFVGDARNLDLVASGSVDLVALHPPYADIIRYGGGLVPGDLSEIRELSTFLQEMGRVAEECFRVLRRGGHCAVLVGDIRRRRHYVLLSYAVLREFDAAGFVLLEDVIKAQHNTTSGRTTWRADTLGFYKIVHEHLFVLRKPTDLEDCRRLQSSLLAVRGLDWGAPRPDVHVPGEV